MSSQNPLNTYTGPNSLINYYDPSCQPPLPLVELPASLNPFFGDGVRVYAKMMTFLPIHNVKALPALNMLQERQEKASGIKSIIEYSSGSTVISMSVMARILYGIDDTRAFLSNKTSEAKLRLMRFFGLNITLFGGPSQPDPFDPRGGIWKARDMAEADRGIFNPNQYENELNFKAHERWTGPQILEQLPEIDVFCAGMGTSGTMTGTGRFLKQRKPTVVRVGVCTAPGDRVPGPRPHALLEPVQFPWREAIDVVEEVGSLDSYRMSMLLSRHGIVCGPSSGFNLQGLLNYLQKCKSDGTMRDSITRSASGTLHCVFICCDLPYQYMDEYFEKMDDECFHPIVNKNLVGVDKYRYDDSWELDEFVVAQKLYGSDSGLLDLLLGTTLGKEQKKHPYESYGKPTRSKPRANMVRSAKPGVLRVKGETCCLQHETALLDLRQESSFAASHLPGASNFPLRSLSTTTPSSFSSSKVLERQWRELESLCTGERMKVLKGSKVVLVDYDGDTARVATSVFRAKGIEAWSLRKGMKGLALKGLAPKAPSTKITSE